MRKKTFPQHDFFHFFFFELSPVQYVTPMSIFLITSVSSESLVARATSHWAGSSCASGVQGNGNVVAPYAISIFMRSDRIPRHAERLCPTISQLPSHLGPLIPFLSSPGSRSTVALLCTLYNDRSEAEGRMPHVFDARLTLFCF